MSLAREGCYGVAKRILGSEGCASCDDSNGWDDLIHRHPQHELPVWSDVCLLFKYGLRKYISDFGWREDLCCLKVDMKNAFNEYPRDSILRRVCTDFPEPFMWTQ